MEDSWRPDDTAGQSGPCPGLAPAAPGHLGAPYSEAWGYFHLAPAGPGHPTGTWATCRLCGEQVGGHPGFQAWTRALWQHLSGAHLRELEKSGARSSPPAAPCPPPPGPAALAAEGDWARLLEQMGALAVRGSRRELELERREAALRQAERALERRRRALRQEERAMAQARRQLQAEREALRTWLREQSPGVGLSAPPLLGLCCSRRTLMGTSPATLSPRSCYSEATLCSAAPPRTSSWSPDRVLSMDHIARDLLQ